MKSKGINDEIDLLTTAEAAALLRLHPFSLHRMRCVGDRSLPWFKVRGRIFYQRKDVVALVESGRFGKGRLPTKPIGARSETKRRSEQ